ncbi:MAG: glycoside hydrolase family 32 protein [Planctomycetes bacterium]|nr:glycoside hydrolase family 32 protein [Planctomycetota bacterium]
MLFTLLLLFGNRPDLPLADFEGADYGTWTLEGNAFGSGPAHGTLRDQNPVSGFEGTGCVNSYLGGDAALGTLTSPEFAIERTYLNFLVGGGAHPGETCVELLVGGAVVRSATGSDDEHLDWESWDLADLAGARARLRIADRASGGWGHINVDSIAQSDERRADPIVTTPLYAETYRPQFHFTSRANWLNDPNGLVFYAGEYHLFFQHNPSGIQWGNMTWGHAVSPDLVHWKQLENALLPDALGTIYSGSAAVDGKNTAGFETGSEKTIVALYTAAGQPFTQCLAYSNDRGRTFTKYAKNPVIPHIAGENRDPKVVWYAPSSRWILALYLEGERYALFSSPDMKSWTKLQELAVPGCGECPDFFEMPVAGEPGTRKWVFTAANGNYLLGSFDGRTFAPEGAPLREDWGRNYYAVQSYSDLPASDGRRIQIAWMNGGRYPRMPFNQQMSFPCELELVRTSAGLRLTRMPVREIESLRTRTRTWASSELAGEVALEAEGGLYDLEAEFEPGSASEVGLSFRGERIAYSVREQRLACLGASAELPLVQGKLKLRVLIDRTSIEVFGNGGRVSLTSCFLPRGKLGLQIYARAGIAKASILVHELRSSWRP